MMYSDRGYLLEDSDKDGLFCEECLTAEELRRAVAVAGEADEPDHCHNCHQLLQSLLSPYGVKLVIETILSSLSHRESWNKIIPDDDPRIHYRGCREVEIVRDWAEELRLQARGSDAEEYVIREFLAASAEPVVSPVA